MTFPPESWRPPHAYVPGQTARHPEGLFDQIRANTDLAWRMGHAFLEEGFYWEAHEVWEPVWMVQPPNAPERALVQGMIQLANASLKARMGKPRAAARLIGLADGHLRDAATRANGPLLGVSVQGISDLRDRIGAQFEHFYAQFPDKMDI